MTANRVKMEKGQAKTIRLQDRGIAELQEGWKEGLQEGLQSYSAILQFLLPCNFCQHEMHLWLFFAPSFSRSASASGHGWMRCTGPLAMSAVVLPSRLTA